MNIDFKCKIKTTSRWQKVTGNKWVIATEPNHLTADSFRNESLSCSSEMQNSVVMLAVCIFFCLRNGAKTGIMVSKM